LREQSHESHGIVDAPMPRLFVRDPSNVSCRDVTIGAPAANYEKAGENAEAEEPHGALQCAIAT
jgi:hypothetical protein